MDSQQTLRPPQVRQTYTPPPQKVSDVEPNADIPNSLQTATGIEDISFCASPADYASQQTSEIRAGDGRHTTEVSSIAAMIRRAVMEHQLGIAVNLILLVGLSWLLFPGLREPLKALYHLCYPSTLQEGMYGQGPNDLGVVVSLIVVFTGLRAFTLDYVLMPIAGLCGIRKRKIKVRYVPSCPDQTLHSGPSPCISH